MDLAKPSAMVIDLYFSEPVATVEPIDPSAFRLSYAMRYGAGADAMTRYEDPMGFLCSTTDYCIDEAEVVSIEPGDDEATLRLTLSTWAPILCEHVAYFAEQFDARLSLHYRGGAKCIEDTDGEPVVGFGQTWVDFEDDYYMLAGSDFPEKPLPIPCPP